MAVDSIYKYPFYFDDKEFYALSPLIEEFVKNFEFWVIGENFFKNDEILFWIEKNRDIDTQNKILEIQETFKDKKIAFFNFIYMFNKNLPFVLLGEKINILMLEKIFIKKYSELSLDEKIIHTLFCNGELIDYSKSYDKLTKQRTVFTRYLIQIDNNYRQKGDKKAILGYLQYLNKTKLYIFPINGEIITLYNLQEYASLDEIEELKIKFNLPGTFIQIMENLHPITHKKIIHKLRNVNSFLLPKDFYLQISQSFIKTTVNMEKFLHIDEWDEIKSNYYMPKILIETIENTKLQEYLKILERLRFLQNKRMLLKCDQYLFHKSLFGNYYNIKVGAFRRIEVDFDKMTIEEYKKLYRILTIVKERKNFAKQEENFTNIKKSRTLLDYLKAFLSFEILPKARI